MDAPSEGYKTLFAVQPTLPRIVLSRVHKLFSKYRSTSRTRIAPRLSEFRNFRLQMVLMNCFVFNSFEYDYRKVFPDPNTVVKRIVFFFFFNVSCSRSYV